MPKITTQEIEVVKVPEEKPLSIRLLGHPEVSFEGRRLRFGRRKGLMGKEPRAVAVIGEAGIGKTRLGEESRERR